MKNNFVKLIKSSQKVIEKIYFKFKFVSMILVALTKPYWIKYTIISYAVQELQFYSI